MAAKSQEFIRDMNYHKILETIIREGSISRAALSKCLGLTKATISSQVQTLLDDGLVEETGSHKTTKGRHPIMLRFCSSHAHVLSFDISPSHIHLLVSNLLGHQCYVQQLPWDQKKDDLLALLPKIIHHLFSLSVLKDKNIIGISLGIHGVVHENQVLFTPYYNLSRLPLQETLEQEFSLPVFLENEANLSALGEKAFSVGASDLVNISVHEGVGLGIILHGRLYTGANGFAGEFGHTIVKPQGRLCPCGNRGCLEQYASETAILRTYRKKTGKKAAVLEDLVADYQKHVPAAREAVEDFISYMAIGINNIVNIFNPQLIVINSVLTACLPDITSQISGRLANSMSRECRLVPSLLQDTATLLGGVCLCSRHYLGIEDFCPPIGSLQRNR